MYHQGLCHCIRSCTAPVPPLDNASVQESAILYRDRQGSYRDIPPRNGCGKWSALSIDFAFIDILRIVFTKFWFYTPKKTFCHIDGNPSHPSNGWIRQMARNHCLASIANYAKQSNANACYKEKDRLATLRAILEICNSADAGKQVSNFILPFGSWLFTKKKQDNGTDPNKRGSYNFSLNENQLILWTNQLNVV
jgi:hypothetical protein